MNDFNKSLQTRKTYFNHIMPLKKNKPCFQNLFKGNLQVVWCKFTHQELCSKMQSSNLMKFSSNHIAQKEQLENAICCNVLPVKISRINQHNFPTESF